jgi:SAM-dependent methyltransferase
MLARFRTLWAGTSPAPTIIYMKKFVITLVFIKFAFLVSLTALAFSTFDATVLSQTAKPAPTATPPTDDAINRPVSEPFKGNPSYFDDANRAEKLQIERVMDVLNIQPGKSVADIGAGSGFFSVRAAKRVGDRGKVYAVEINQNFINYINDRARRENFSNIQTVLGAEDNPNLPANSVDAVLILNTYHEIAQPIRLMKNLLPALKKDALVGIIDRNGTGDDHGIDKEKVIEEARTAGYELAGDHDFVKYERMDYFVVFRKIE